MPSVVCHQEWSMELDPQASIIVTIATGICLGLTGYLAYVMISILATA
jgi:hypothetical protein